MYKLLFIHRLRLKKDEWVFKKEFTIPFPPYPGLILKEFKVCNSSPDPKEVKPWILAFPWKVGCYTVGSECYWNVTHECFVVETVQNSSGDPPNDLDSFQKILLSQGWELAQEPVKKDLTEPVKQG